jgi:hypothetical protein
LTANSPAVRDSMIAKMKLFVFIITSGKFTAISKPHHN